MQIVCSVNKWALARTLSVCVNMLPAFSPLPLLLISTSVTQSNLIRNQFFSLCLSVSSSTVRRHACWSKPRSFIWMRGWHPFTSSRIHTKYIWPCMLNMTLMVLRVYKAYFLRLSNFSEQFYAPHTICATVQIIHDYLCLHDRICFILLLQIKQDPDFNEESSYQIIPPTPQHRHKNTHPLIPQSM